MRRRFWLVVHGVLLAAGVIGACNCDRGYRGGYYGAPAPAPYAGGGATYASPTYSGTTGGRTQPAMPPASGYDSTMPQGSGSRMPQDSGTSMPQGSGLR